MSFLRTQSVGVRRLSLVAGVIAVVYHLVTLDQPFGPPAQDPSHPFRNVVINIGNLALEGALLFALAWASVRIIAWVVEGFLQGRMK